MLCNGLCCPGSVAICCMGFWQIIMSAVLCGLVVVVPSGAVWFVVFACLPYSQERKGSGVFFLTCFWASLERSGVMLISSKWGAVMRVTLLSTGPSSWHSGQSFTSEGRAFPPLSTHPRITTSALGTFMSLPHFLKHPQMASKTTL